MKIKLRSIDDELEKNSDIKREDIQKLREWVNSQPHLPGEHITDLDLFLAYHSCEKSAEVSKQVLDLHYTLRTQVPVLKDCIYDDDVKKMMNTFVTTLLPATTKEGYKIVLIYILDPNPKNFTLSTYLRGFLMLLDLWQNMEGSWPGFILLIDAEKSSIGHITRLEITIVQQFLYFVQEALYVKLKSIHFLNTISVVDKVLMMMKPFLKDGLIHKVLCHETSSIGDEDIHAALPQELGGQGKSVVELRDEVIALVEENQDLFKTINLKKVDETKRPGRQKTISDFFGSIEGSFKTLDID